MTLRDVARVAGVSIKTVSRVINNEPNVAPETSARVQQAISRLNYVPNSAARSLSRGKAMAIGLVVGWPVGSAFSSMLIDNMVRDTVRSDRSLMLFSSDAGAPSRVAAAFASRQIDSVVLDSVAADNESLIDRLDTMKKPYVVVHPNDLDRCKNGWFVRIDNFEGAKEATSYLIGLGHRRIGLVTFPAKMPGTERLTGYRAGLEEAGIRFDPDYIYEELDVPVQIGYRGALHLLTAHPEITAIFAATDEIAMGAMSAIWQLGMRVPEDISVIGFDDISLASVIAPPLTTIHQPVDEISRAAVAMAVELAEDRGSDRADLVLSTRLVVRSSCQPPRSDY